MEQQGIRNTYKYKLKPTPEEARLLERTVMLCRHLYHAAVGERRDAWRMRGISVRYDHQKAELPGIKEALPEYGDAQHQVLQDLVLRVERAFQAFFRRIASGAMSGSPRFHGRDRDNRFTSPQVGERGGARLENGVLVLSKLGGILVRWSRPLEGTPKTVTISREADGWYGCFSCAEVLVAPGAPGAPGAPPGQETGIDLGLASFATRADGTMIHTPRCSRKADRHLKRMQHCVSRRKTGSNRRRKAVQHLARAHQTVKRQRQDFHHEVAHSLVQQYNTIYYEDVPTANLLKHHHLAKSISDAGWCHFLSIRAFKAAHAGKHAVAGSPAYTSQDCSGCGERIAKSLSVRTQVCTSCGLVLDCDQNAALNILQGGNERAVGQTVQALTWAGGASVA